MPVVRRINRRLMVVPLLDRSIAQMPMPELVEYEAFLWSWMDKSDNPVNIARILNMVHREVEWRATNT